MFPSKYIFFYYEEVIIGIDGLVWDFKIDVNGDSHEEKIQCNPWPFKLVDKA